VHLKKQFSQQILQHLRQVNLKMLQVDQISSEVSSVRITSPVLRNQISLAKCNAKNFSGLPVTSLN
jgi:hypothetical protein